MPHLQLLYIYICVAPHKAARSQRKLLTAPWLADTGGRANEHSFMSSPQHMSAVSRCLCIPVVSVDRSMSSCSRAVDADKSSYTSLSSTPCQHMP
jgi:hypothetical protein